MARTTQKSNINAKSIFHSVLLSLPLLLRYGKMENCEELNLTIRV